MNDSRGNDFFVVDSRLEGFSFLFFSVFFFFQFYSFCFFIYLFKNLRKWCPRTISGKKVRYVFILIFDKTKRE